MKPTDEIPVIFADQIRSLNYSAPVPPSPFSTAGTLFDLFTGSITSTGLAVDGVTGDVEIRGEVTATSFVIVDSVGDVSASWDTSVDMLGPYPLDGLLFSRDFGAGWVTGMLAGQGAATSIPGYLSIEAQHADNRQARVFVFNEQVGLVATGTAGTGSTFYLDSGTTGVALSSDGPVDISGTLLTIGSPTTVPDGSAGSPTIRFAADTNTGIYRQASDTFAVTAGGTLRLRVGAVNEWRSNTPPTATTVAGSAVGTIRAYDSGSVRLNTTRALSTSLAYLSSTYDIIPAKGRAYKLHVHGVADVGHTGGVSTNVVELWWRFNASGSFTLADTAKMITGAAAGYRINAAQSWILDVPANTTVELRLYGVRIGGTSASVYSVHTGYTWFAMG